MKDFGLTETVNIVQILQLLHYALKDQIFNFHPAFPTGCVQFTSTIDLCGYKEYKMSSPDVRVPVEYQHRRMVLVEPLNVIPCR